MQKTKNHKTKINKKTYITIALCIIFYFLLNSFFPTNLFLNPTKTENNKYLQTALADTTCQTIETATACQNYSCQIEAIDPDGHKINYHDYSQELPNGLTINQDTGLISGTILDQIKQYIINITIKD